MNARSSILKPFKPFVISCLTVAGLLVGLALSLGLWTLLLFFSWITEEAFANLIGRVCTGGCVLGGASALIVALLRAAPHQSTRRRIGILSAGTTVVATVCALLLGKPYVYRARNDVDHVAYFLGFYHPPKYVDISNAFMSKAEHHIRPEWRDNGGVWIPNVTAYTAIPVWLTMTLYGIAACASAAPLSVFVFTRIFHASCASKPRL